MDISVPKKKRVSKKSKKSWRKNSNINDVNEFLDEQRLDERIGDLSAKKDEQLFTIDKKADRKSIISLKQHRLKMGNRMPTSLSILNNSSNVTDPIAKRNRVKCRAKDINKKLGRKKELLRNTKLQKGNPTKLFNDIWSSEVPGKFQCQWIAKPVASHHLRNSGVITVNPPKAAYHNRSQLNAVSIPHPGTSYNPSLEDHQHLMENVLAAENLKIKEEQHLHRITTATFDMKTVEERDADILKELQAASENDDDDDDDNIASVNRSIVVKRKNSKSLQKKKTQNEMKQQSLKLKQERKKLTDIDCVKHISNDIDKFELSLQIMRQRKQIRKALHKVKPRRIGKWKFEDENIEIALPDDISGNLRNIKTDASILTDRFKSMQRRNILPPSIDEGLRRRHEVKRFTRKSHKEDNGLMTKIKKKNEKKVLT